MKQVAHELGGDGTGAVVELAGRGLGARDQFGRVLRAVRGEHRQHRDGLRRQGDRREVVQRVVGQALVEVLVHHQRRVDCHEQGVAIGRRFGGRLRADDGVGARPVLDHDRLAPVLAHLLADHPRHDVRRTAGGKRHDDPHRAVRKVTGVGVGSFLCGRRAGGKGARQGERSERCCGFHGISSRNSFSFLLPSSLLYRSLATRRYSGMAGMPFNWPRRTAMLRGTWLKTNPLRPRGKRARSKRIRTGRSPVDVQRQQAEDRPVRRQLLVRPRRHHGAGALVGKLGGQSQARAHGGRGRHRLHAADRPLEGLRRRHRLPGRDARDHHLGVRACWRRPSASPCSAPCTRRCSIRSSRPRRWSPPTTSARAASGSTSSSAGTRASSRCSASQQREHEDALRICAGMDRRHQDRSGRTARISTSTASYLNLKGIRAKPKPYGGTRPVIMNAGASPTGQAFAIRNCDAFFLQAVAHLARRDRAARRDREAGGEGARPRDRRLYGRRRHLPADAEGGGGLLPPLRSSSTPTGRRSTASWRSRTSRRRPCRWRSSTSSAGIRARHGRPADRRRSRPGGEAARRPQHGRPDRHRDLAASTISTSLPFFCDEVLPRLERMGLREKR